MEQAIARLSNGLMPPVLMFDYDGTLAPFVVERAQARPYPDVKRLLESLCTQTAARLVIISGREAREASRLLGMQAPIEVWGCHGWQRIIPGRGEVTGALPADARTMLDELERLLGEEGYEVHLERKPASLALHWRGTADEERLDIEQCARRLWENHIDSGALEQHAFDGGLEWRLPNWSKAHAVDTVVGEHDEGVPVAYFGDDLTDEDAFKALPTGGVAVLVREEFRPTAAELWLRPPGELCEFLEKLLFELENTAPRP